MPYTVYQPDPARALIGFMMAGATRRKQALRDKLKVKPCRYREAALATSFQAVDT